jgi:hypothetical protein
MHRSLDRRYKPWSQILADDGKSPQQRHVAAPLQPAEPTAVQFGGAWR